jgi:hypothetical protein
MASFVGLFGDGGAKPTHKKFLDRFSIRIGPFGRSLRHFGSRALFVSPRSSQKILEKKSCQEIAKTSSRGVDLEHG